MAGRMECYVSTLGHSPLQARSVSSAIDFAHIAAFDMAAIADQLFIEVNAPCKVIIGG